MDSYKTFLALYEKLLSQSLFYIPNDLVVEGIQEMIDVLLSDFTDRLLFLSQDGKAIPFQNPGVFEKIMIKRYILQASVTQLLNLKNTIDEDSFSYLEEKYMEYVNIACYVSKLLYDNVKTFFPNEILVLYNSFLVQQNTMEEHRNELVRVLKITNNQPYSLEDLKNLSSLQNPIYKDAFTLESTELQWDGLNMQPTDSITIISDEDARNFLLETVFSIPSDQISK